MGVMAEFWLFPGLLGRVFGGGNDKMCRGTPGEI